MAYNPKNCDRCMNRNVLPTDAPCNACSEIRSNALASHFTPIHVAPGYSRLVRLRVKSAPGPVDDMVAAPAKGVSLGELFASRVEHAGLNPDLARLDGIKASDIPDVRDDGQFTLGPNHPRADGGRTEAPELLFHTEMVDGRRVVVGIGSGVPEPGAEKLSLTPSGDTVSVPCLRCATPNFCGRFGCSPNTVASEVNPGTVSTADEWALAATSLLSVLSQIRTILGIPEYALVDEVLDHMRKIAPTAPPFKREEN